MAAGSTIQPNCLDFILSRRDCSILSPGHLLLLLPWTRGCFWHINPLQFPPFVPKLCQAPLCHHLNSPRATEAVSKWALGEFWAPGASLQIATRYDFKMRRGSRATWSGCLMGANQGRRTGERQGRTETDSSRKTWREMNGPTAKIYKQMLVYLADVKLCLTERSSNKSCPRTGYKTKSAAGSVNLGYFVGFSLCCICPEFGHFSSILSTKSKRYLLPWMSWDEMKS